MATLNGGAATAALRRAKASLQEASDAFQAADQLNASEASDVWDAVEGVQFTFAHMVERHNRLIQRTNMRGGPMLARPGAN